MGIGFNSLSVFPQGIDANLSKEVRNYLNCNRLQSD